MYSLIRPLLFRLDPERAHDVTLSSLKWMSRRGWACHWASNRYANRIPKLPVSCMGIDFKHPIGLAAGLDKDARALAMMSALGFSGVELGTVTPKPQAGNDKPRLFRLLEDQAIVNRMGFNSAGVDTFLQNLNTEFNQSVIGINVGKNAVTPIKDAHYDYISALQRVYQQADYLTVNISSPNTKSLRDLQNAEFLDGLLAQIKKAQMKCHKVHNRYVPIALKVAPDLTEDEIETISELLITHDFDGLIATNTTVQRPEGLQSELATEAGGLSGQPVRDLSLTCIQHFYAHLKGRIPIIGVGGISSAEDAWEKMLAGADYLQVYTAFIYQGPQLIEDIVVGLKAKMQSHGFEDLPTAMFALRS